MSSLTLAILIFSIAYLFIVTERVHKTIVALFGAALFHVWQAHRVPPVQALASA